MDVVQNGRQRIRFQQRKVNNRISAKFTIENGKIIRHQDHFSFYTWAKQALGLFGLLFGWTGYVKNQVQKKGMESLERYLSNRLN